MSSPSMHYNLIHLQMSVISVLSYLLKFATRLKDWVGGGGMVGGGGGVGVDIVRDNPMFFRNCIFINFL